jgi:hypothetical protein
MIRESKDIVVTTPKSEMKNAEKEAKYCIESGDGYYFRTFKKRPKGLEIGSKIFYIEDGYVRGFGEVGGVARGEMECEATDRVYGSFNDQRICHAIMPACTWKWIKPIPMKGFQGFRYFDEEYEVIGGWLDPKPPIET